MGQAGTTCTCPGQALGSSCCSVPVHAPSLSCYLTTHRIIPCLFLLAIAYAAQCCTTSFFAWRRTSRAITKRHTTFPRRQPYLHGMPCTMARACRYRHASLDRQHARRQNPCQSDVHYHGLVAATGMPSLPLCQTAVTYRVPSASVVHHRHYRAG